MIIGNGNMAKAIIDGLVKANYNIEVVGRDNIKLEKLKDEYPTLQVKTFDEGIDITNKDVIFSVKPFNLVEVGAKLTGCANILYSVLAGTKIESLKENIQANFYVRVMPNVSAKFSKSMTTLCGDETKKQNAIDIFESIGSTLWVKSENELDIATAVAGSGPAFLAYFADSIINGAVECGLQKEDAIKLTNGLFNGFTPLLENEPKDIIKKVMSPNGTTQAGYEYLNQQGVDKKISKTIRAAYNRALELAKG
jgi:pyrroline-5-carboxylate reductase